MSSPITLAGKILDLTLTRVARYGRIAICRTISNDSPAAGSDVEAAGINNWFQVVVNRPKIKSFITFDLGERIGEYMDKLTQVVKEGKIKLSDDNNTVVGTKWEDFLRTWNLLF
ncbi:hypothetical protein DPV78_009837 [Talaromyces pinophilus]|nr:hypothetical protein DPV78_009837 [Talaromyces pinophilus]